MAGDEAALSTLGEPGPYGGRAWEGIIRAYSEFFPVSAKTPVVTLMEGRTPLVEAPNLSANRRAALEGRAMSELLKATPSAADATSQDGSWNALMTTINESERVPLKDLIPSLTRLCKVADSSSPYI